LDWAGGQMEREIKMVKMILVISLFPIIFMYFQQDTVVNYNYEKDTPEWLKTKIDSMLSSNHKYYWGTRVFRYEWNDSLLFEFNIPPSSCALCELFYYNGTKANFLNNSTVQNYLTNRNNKLLIWKWPDK
jgi:hypothetical protein